MSTVAGLARALELLREGQRADVRASRDALQEALLREVPWARINGDAPRLPSHLSVSFPGLSGDALVVALDACGIAASSGAACSSGTPGPSPVLLAMGRSAAEATGSLRLSLERPLTAAEVARVSRAVAEQALRLQSLAP